MASDAILKKVKDDLRITHNMSDESLRDEIDACLLDLEVTAGVLDPDPTDGLILNAIKLFCRINEEDNENAVRVYMKRYDALKSSLQMAAGYGGAK